MDMCIQLVSHLFGVVQRYVGWLSWVPDPVDHRERIMSYRKGIEQNCCFTANLTLVVYSAMHVNIRTDALVSRFAESSIWQFANLAMYPFKWANLPIPLGADLPDHLFEFDEINHLAHTITLTELK